VNFTDIYAVTPSVAIHIPVTILIMVNRITLHILTDVNGVVLYRSVTMMDIPIHILGLYLFYDLRGTTGKGHKRKVTDKHQND
jgi:hypothetical protein